MHCVGVVIARDCLLAKDPSGSSSDDGGFLPGAEVEGEGVGDSGHTLPVRNSRSVQSMSSHDVVGILFALRTPPRAVDSPFNSEECNLYLLSGYFACLLLVYTHRFSYVRPAYSTQLCTVTILWNCSVERKSNDGMKNA